MKIPPKEFCKRFDPCTDGAKFALKYKTMSEVWDNCERGDWLLWILGRLDVNTKAVRLLACDIAERSLVHFAKRFPDDKRPAECIAKTREYVEGKCTLKELEKARAAAAFAAFAAAAAAFAAAAAAFAAFAAAARNVERKWQADHIRTKIENPFT